MWEGEGLFGEFDEVDGGVVTVKSAKKDENGVGEDGKVSWRVGGGVRGARGSSWKGGPEKKDSDVAVDLFAFLDDESETERLEVLDSEKVVSSSSSKR